MDPTHIEGPNVPDEPHLGVCNHNCQHGGICTAMLFAPQTAAQQGFLCVTACQQSDADPLPHLPPGDYAVARSVCVAGWAPVCTAQAISLSSSGADGGCDRPGVRAESLPMRILKSPLTLYRRLRPAPPTKPPKATVTKGRCHVRRDGRMTCQWH